MNLNQVIADELGVRASQVEATVELLDEGATVPFIARYRKERTGGLDDTQLRTLEERLTYLRDMVARRDAVLESIRDQDKLTPALEAQIMAADTKTRLEDLYLPYKPKRRTKGQIAIEAGLEPLADLLFGDPKRDPETEAAAFINAEKGIETSDAALEGARFILMERFAEEADLLGTLRAYVWKHGSVTAKVGKGKEQEGAKFRDYFDYHEGLAKVPSHRALAIFRGFKEGILRLEIAADPLQLDPDNKENRCEKLIAAYFGIEDRGRPADAWLQKVVQWTWKVKIYMHLKTELLGEIRQKAEEEAIKVFGRNLGDLLMAAPAGDRVTMGLDPGLRTGVKVVVVDDTGKLVDQATIYPHPPQKKWDDAKNTLATLCRKHKVALISIGNGTGSRETDRLAGELIKEAELAAAKIVVNEAGASVYSASALAAAEFPDLDVSLRGAVSIARRLQDPLAELVKIDPKSIGVGQYQHDVNQTRLAGALENVVEDCVNAVGVDLNMASAPLLARVSGLSQSLANNIVEYRNQHGRFADRKQLLEVKRLGPKAFEQAAGFLRILGGKNPLDASAVHPEAYPVVERIVKQGGKPVGEILGDRDFLKNLKAADFADERFGLPTVNDILNELEKPGRDPRPEFKTANLTDGIEEITDLEPGMILEGTVTNVTNFGAFVDVGVHQDGLVHISALANRFVSDPREVVRAGDVVKVKVMEVDLERRRIGMSMRLDDEPGKKIGREDRGGRGGRGGRERKPREHQTRPKQAPNTAMGAAFAALNKRGKK
ncbi:Tex family protein [Acanthopleuribacter pedis]|uniref:RNA-binding transcriptional accessory protein n=1 Tax=Acanthopleuribacter pedis TaxID=442870 RepID=A0A8J7QHS3_9BACT|nr:Tex family protein [Acanthopleuribacter pedis]MBO1320495.1 RNA-binding transcriptional accessory protein [Acanthopleuribacter pedis]